MKMAVVSVRDIGRMQRWDAPHLIQCVEHGGDIVEASKQIKASAKLRDLLDRAKNFMPSETDLD